MLPTYRAVLRGGHLEWEDEVPEQTADQQRLDVFVTIVSDALSDGESRGRRMARALEALAQKGGVAIADGSDWQRDQRGERRLPGHRVMLLDGPNTTNGEDHAERTHDQC